LKAKKYIKVFLLLSLLFLAFHSLTWNLITKQLFIQKDNMVIGDLGRISYSLNSLTVRKNEQNLLSKHIEYTDNIEIDILTIGDSFSNGGAAGPNRYYQDYISTKNDLRVMNMQSNKEGFIETVLTLMKSGHLDILKPKAIILQTAERNAIARYSKKINWDINLKDSSTYFINKKYINRKPIPSFINNLNYNAVLYSLLYQYDDNAYFSNVYKVDMSKKLFSCKDKSKLLFYNKDLKYILNTNTTAVKLLNDNLNKLQNILHEKNIQLYFMPVVDKYNLYSKYIINNNYPKSIFFEELRPLNKHYEFIDTKKILAKKLDENIKDVYYSDDSHWSFIGIEAVFENIEFK